MLKSKHITILGGGTAGLVSALILQRRFLNLNITIIKSNKIDIVGVGEGSSNEWRLFMEYCKIDYKELIKNCDATIKYGVFFDNWTKKPYYHNLSEVYSSYAKVGQYLAGYGYHIYNNHEQLASTSMFQDNNNTICKNFLDNDIVPSPQFHFNTFKLNDYLIKLCIEKGIKIIDDEIKDVSLDEKGNIKSLKGEKNYTSDFFIDCTGFRKILISKLGAKWKSHGKFLKMKEAIAFPTKDTEEYNTYTLARGMKYGWMFRIPTFGRWGNGYIFDSNYINAEQAKKEAEEYLGHEVEVKKNIKFDPGYLDKTWIKNCLAIGLSANFIEPLEATSIGTSINQVFLFLHYFFNYNEKDIEDYNKKINSIMENIRDFIFLHYMVERNDTEFWKDIKKLEVPEKLQRNLEKWKHRLPINEDIIDTNYHLFLSHNYATVLWGINKIDKSIKKEYLTLNDFEKKYVENLILQYKKTLKTEQISHKEYLKKIRNI